MMAAEAERRRWMAEEGRGVVTLEARGEAALRDGIIGVEAERWDQGKRNMVVVVWVGTWTVGYRSTVQKQ